MRIAHLTFDMRIGGAERVIKTLIECMDQPNYEVSVICLEPNIGPFGEELLQGGHRIDSIPKKPGFDISVVFKLRKYLLENRISILHCHQYTPWVYGALASILTKTTVIFTEHGRFYPDRSSWKRRLVNPLLLRMTGAVTTISKATRNALEEFEGLPQPAVQIVYNGIEPLLPCEYRARQLRGELDIPESAMVVGTVARLDPVKNHEMMIRAFLVVAERVRSIYLLIVGDGPERPRLQKLVCELKLENKVVFTGAISNPQSHLLLMDVFLLSSLSEGAAMTLLEAMSIGKPCVVTRAGGNPELIVDQYNGLVVESDDYHAFAHGIICILENKPLRLSMGENSLKRFNEAFTERSMSKQYLDLYRRLGSAEKA